MGPVIRSRGARARFAASADRDRSGAQSIWSAGRAPSEAIGGYGPQATEVRPEEQIPGASVESVPGDSAPVDTAREESGRGESDAYPLQSGDRLKVMVYDRADLTAEYRVSDQGRIRIPTLGPSTRKIAQRLKSSKRLPLSLSELMHRPGIVTVDVIERRPVFVTGLVAKPGAYRFSAGMAVIQATALAGGTASGANAASLPIEALREGSRMQASEEELRHLLAIQARLTAERTESSEIVSPPSLIQLAGPERAANLIRDERENMTRSGEIFDRRKALLDELD